jgi:hypothetical protein
MNKNHHKKTNGSKRRKRKQEKKRKERAIDQKVRVKKVMAPKNKVLTHVQLVSCSYLRLSMAQY